MCNLAIPHPSKHDSASIPLTRILIITDAWLPQINGVVRSIEALVRVAGSRRRN